MHRRVVCLPVLFALFMLTSTIARAATIVWDHPSPSTVTGYAVTINGTRTDHALRVAGTNGACSCSLSVNLAPGSHTVIVAAYNAVGETRTAPLTVTIPSSSTPPTITLPSGWSSQDIGSTGLTGSTTYTNGTFTVAAAGADVWGTRDSFHYVHTGLTTDGTITARVQSIENNSSWAMAGVMMRATTDSSSQHVSLHVKPDGAVEMMSRQTSGGTTSFRGTTNQAAPVWLRLRRTGTTITGQYSTNGSTWSNVGSTTVSGIARAGLFVASTSTSVRNTSVFDSVSVSGASGSTGTGTSTSTGASEVVIYANDVPSTAVRGAWSKVSSGSAAASVKLTSSNVGVANTSAPLASPKDYVDVTFNAVANTPYALWVRLRAINNDKYNDSLWVQFSDARVNGSKVFGIGSTSGLLLNLGTSSSASNLNGWGWQNGAYWFTQPKTFTFGTTGTQTIRIQTREDGIEFDQIVLSPSRYLNTAPGPVSADTTIVPQ